MMMNKFQQTAAPAPVVSAPATTPDKPYLHTMQAGASLPLVQTFITAVVVGISVAILAWMFDVLDAGRYGLIVGVLTLVSTWLFHLRRWFDLTAIERTINLDLNRDGVIGEQPKPRQVIRVQIDHLRENGHIQQQSIIDLPVSENKLAKLALGLVNGIPFSEKRWSGDGKLFSIDEFRALRYEMIKRELVTLANEKDRRQGYTLTETGRALMKQTALSSPTPLEEQE